MRLHYGKIGSDGDKWPSFVRELDGKSGVYVIRNIDAGDVIYVGSSKGRLYDTITRHFQQWTRKKKWWSKAYGRGGHDPGVTYKRKNCEIAILICNKDKAIEIEADLIEKLQPIDNITQRPDGRDPEGSDEVPF